MARPGEHRALMVQDARAFGDSTTSLSIDRSVARTRVEELRVLEEDGNRLGLLLARGQPVFWVAGRCRPARCPACRSGPSTAAAGSRPSCSATWTRSTSAGRPSPPCSRRPSSSTGGPATSSPAPGPCTRPRPGTCRRAGRRLPGRARPGRRPGPPPGALRPRGRRPQRPGRPGRRLVARLPARRPGQRPAPGVPGRRPRRPTPGRSSPSPATSRPATSAPASRWSTGGGQRGRLAVAAHPGGRLLVAGGERALEGPRPRAARPARGRAGHPPAPPGPLDGQGGRRGRGVHGGSYPAGLRGRITIGVSDDTCPWVDGTWTIEVDGGEGKAVRVGDDAELRTNAAGLAALFAGYHDPRDLAALGVVRGLDQAGVEFLQAMHAGPSPWSPDYY